MAKNTFSQVLADIMALTDAEKHTLLMTLVALGQSSASKQAQAPTSAPSAPKERTLEPATDVTLALTPVSAGKGKVAFTLGFGKGREGAKLMLKDAGFTWDASLALEGVRKGAYVGACKNTLGLTSKSTTLNVPATWVQAGRDKAAEKAAKKANKGA